MVILLRVSITNLSLQYVNFMNGMGSFGVGASSSGSCMGDLLRRVC